MNQREDLAGPGNKVPLNAQPACKHLYSRNLMPLAAQGAKRVISLQMHPDHSHSKQMSIVAILAIYAKLQPDSPAPLISPTTFVTTILKRDKLWN